MPLYTENSRFHTQLYNYFYASFIVLFIVYENKIQARQDERIEILDIPILRF